ncbi:MAG: KamA family radical SAM protein [Candidatus Bathyarchaeota archaeon]
MKVSKKKNLKKIVQRHPMRITPYYMSLIDWDDPDDPIRKMAIPSLQELNLQGSYDTSGEAENTKMSGLQYKYEETALILATNKCAMYCRHCFRKRLVGLQTTEIIKRFEDAADFIKQHKKINNVLISGGDPLVLKNEVIEAPVTFPSRFEDDELLQIMSAYSHPDRRIYVITQFNHPREITPDSIKAVNNLIKSGVVLNNQTVLLKGVNDNSLILADLLDKLVSIGVNPYYIFHCRPVKRVKHNFQLPLLRGIEIVENAKKLCNGHSKRFKYILSHRTGKIEILGIFNDEIYFKYHQAKNRKKLGKIFTRPIAKKIGWLEDLRTYPVNTLDAVSHLS